MAFASVCWSSYCVVYSWQHPVAGFAHACMPCRYMDHVSLQEAVVEPALLQPVNFQEPVSHAEKVAIRSQQLRWYDARMPAIAEVLQKLPEADRELLWSLRNGRRSWRLDLADWSKLARVLLEASPAGGSPHPPLGASVSAKTLAGSQLFLFCVW